jgi:urea carboxylase
VRIEETTFSLADYNRFLADEAESIAVFKERQQGAFHAERERWAASGQANFVAEEACAGDAMASDLPEGSEYLTAAVPGSVWKIAVPQGEQVKEGEVIAIFESMKMEIITEWLVGEGMPVNAGQAIAVFKRNTHA